MKNFFEHLKISITINYFNFYLDNEKTRTINTKLSFYELIRKGGFIGFIKFFYYCFKIILYPFINYFWINIFSKLNIFNRFISPKILNDPIMQFEYIYDILGDDYSKEVLIERLSYQILGCRKYKLSVSLNEEYKRKWQIYEGKKLDKYIETNGFKLHYFDLNEFDIPLKLFSVPQAILLNLDFPQYEYKNKLKVKNGDVILDCGACWGDTAHFFAHKCGSDGKVYSFEFTTENLKIFQRNLDINKELNSRIKLIRKAVFSDSEHEFYINENGGPGTSIYRNVELNTIKVQSISIDDLVKEENLNRVDLIKMDIEGAELDALKGAEKVIRTFKPKLSICVYHKPDDLLVIPKFIQSLNLGYKFYLDHFTTHNEETVLYAVVE